MYETPSEFVRDLIRRRMEKMAVDERHTLNSLLRQSIAENNYTPLTTADADGIRQALISQLRQLYHGDNTKKCPVHSAMA